MAHSISFHELTEAQRRCFDELGIGPGDRIYVRKLKRLTEEDLFVVASRKPGEAASIHSLAVRFERNPKTIATRLRQLKIGSIRAEATS